MCCIQYKWTWKSALKYEISYLVVRGVVIMTYIYIYTNTCICVWAIVTFVLSTFYCVSHLYFRFMYTRSDNTLICVFNTTLMFFITRWNVRSLARLLVYTPSPILLCFRFLASYLSLSIYIFLLLSYCSHLRQRCCRHTHWVYISKRDDE